MRAFFITALAIAACCQSSADTLAIVNGRIETIGPAGTLDRGTVLVVDGKITAVGAQVSVPAGARIIDAVGGVVTPGLIAASSSLTVSEIDSLRLTRDDRTRSTRPPCSLPKHDAPA